MPQNDRKSEAHHLLKFGMSSLACFEKADPGSKQPTCDPRSDDGIDVVPDNNDDGALSEAPDNRAITDLEKIKVDERHQEKPTKLPNRSGQKMTMVAQS